MFGLIFRSGSASVNVVESFVGTLKQELMHRRRFVPAQFERPALGGAANATDLSSACA
jgi:hypothetical protein